jgi:hypothetical protein
MPEFSKAKKVHSGRDPIIKAAENAGAEISILEELEDEVIVPLGRYESAKM